jgi:hypothetical protein
MESESPLLCLNELNIKSCSNPVKSSPHHHTLFYQWIHITSASYSDPLKNHLDLQSDQSDIDMWLEVSFATWQCLAPYCLCNSCNNLRLALSVSPTSTILSRLITKWLQHVWATKRGNGRKEVPFWWRGIAGSARVVVKTTKRIFF